MPDRFSRESPEYFAALALQQAKGNYQQALENTRLTLKVLARWKIHNIIGDGNMITQASPLTRLTFDYDPAGH
ncbi:MAG: hypothetical protein EOO77_13130 [Oxalobacteraceae bacterium]|nr:MAG: hypothetical protein EOO77_13130 [Oxalobacteraceae bacterium]